VIDQVDRAGESNEENAHHEAESDQILERLGKRRSEYRDGFVITQSVEE